MTAEHAAETEERSYPTGQHPDLPPPPGTAGIVGWMRSNLFSTPVNALLTLGALYLAYLLLSWAWSWIVVDSVTSGEDQTICRLAGSLEEYQSNLDLVNWPLLEGAGPAAGATEAEVARFEQRRADSVKFLGRAESSFGTFNQRVGEAGDWLPAELGALTQRLDSVGLHAGLKEAIAAQDWAGVRARIDDSRPLVVWGESHGGACWTVVKVRVNFFLFAFYPQAEQWRPILAGALLLLALVPVLFKVPYRRRWLWFTYLYPVLAYFLLTGLEPLMAVVPTSIWGGLLVTIVVGFTGIVASLPTGILLALGRRSRMPVVRIFCIVFIECIRGVPLITLLFMASTMLQLFLPRGVDFDLLLRALIVVWLFASAYMAEVIRGGLQAMPKGQYEAAQALGLSYWRTMRLIILPQALKITLPGIVNTFIGLFKDTSLLLTIGIYDFLGAAQAAVTDARWKGLAHEVYVFAAVIYFIICFSMSRYSLYLEKKLNTGHKRR